MKRLGLTEGRRRLQEGRRIPASKVASEGFRSGDTITGVMAPIGVTVDITIKDMFFEVYTGNVIVEYEVKDVSGDSDTGRTEASRFYKEWLKG